MYDITHNFTYRQKDKGWQVILSYKDGDRWRQKSKQGLKTKQLAKAAGLRLYEDLKKSFVPSSNDLAHITLKEFIPIFIKDKPLLSDSSKYSFNRIPIFFDDLGNKMLAKITTADIIRAVTKNNHYADHTISQQLALLHAVFSHAINVYGFTMNNPVSNVPRRKRIKSSRIKSVSQADFERLLASDVSPKHENYKICVQLAYYTGMRFGEMAGLSWDDVSFSTGIISVKRQLKVCRIDGKVQHRIGALKTNNSYRDIPMPGILIRVLSDWKPNTVPTSVLGFRTAESYPLNYWIKKTLPNTSIHDFRHTYATNLLANGVDVKTVAALCGDTVTTIINTYIDFTEEMRKKASRDVDAIFSK